ncbi:acyl-CoA dehydrogenase, N-terminal domain protein [Mycobacterium xenopi 4042]|uniref:Acyl-CoA dehydrogenase, N-terminal domain protein n=1 Tax=Mycobacterium xenopi 4042 TaxID=1299334 RepID=X8AHR4_MYCXE|nr:acyl-CoA dehydrogenase, N-terminal domain protein [Mycobacterium xenopi 4042]
MRRELFTDDHEAFRQLARDFIEKEIEPHYAEWEKAAGCRARSSKSSDRWGCWAWRSRRNTAGQAFPTTATTSSCRRKPLALW